MNPENPDKPTDEEVKKIHHLLDTNEEFRKEFMGLVQELGDSKKRKEHELLIEQLEKQGKSMKKKSHRTVPPSNHKKKTKPSKPDKKKKKKKIQDLGKAVPKHFIVHSGHFDLSQHFNDPSLKNRNVPQNLKVEIFLPLIRNIGEVDLEIRSDFLCVKETKHYAALELILPYRVDDEKGSAKWLKKKKKLVVTLPVGVKKEDIKPFIPPKEEIVEAEKEIQHPPQSPEVAEKELKEQEDGDDSPDVSKEKEMLNQAVENEHVGDKISLQEEKSQSNIVEEIKPISKEKVKNVLPPKEEDIQEDLPPVVENVSPQQKEKELAVEKKEKDKNPTKEKIIPEGEKVVEKKIVRRSVPVKEPDTYVMNYFNVKFKNKYLYEID